MAIGENFHSIVFLCRTMLLRNSLWTLQWFYVMFYTFRKFFLFSFFFVKKAISIFYPSSKIPTCMLLAFCLHALLYYLPLSKNSLKKLAIYFIYIWKEFEFVKYVEPLIFKEFRMTFEAFSRHCCFDLFKFDFTVKGAVHKLYH